jgi:hypothetical protein
MSPTSFSCEIALHNIYYRPCIIFATLSRKKRDHELRIARVGGQASGKRINTAGMERNRASEPNMTGLMCEVSSAYTQPRQVGCESRFADRYADRQKSENERCQSSLRLLYGDGGKGRSGDIQR